MVVLFAISLLYVKDINRLQDINYTEINSVNGVWDLREIDFTDTVIALRGDVIYIDGEMLDPLAFEENIDKAKIGDPIDFNEGRTAKLTVLMPDENRYAMNFVGDYARKVYVNGELIGHFGNPSNIESEFVAAYGEINTSLKAYDNKYEIIVQGGNFVHREGTSYANTIISGTNLYAESEELRTGIETFLFGILFVLFIIYLLIATLLGNKAQNLLFAFICLLYAIRLSLISSKVLYDFFPTLPWELAFKLEYISISASSILLVFIVYLQFKQAVSKKVIYIMAFLFLAFTLVFIFGDTITVSYLMIYTNATYLISLLYFIISIAIYFIKKSSKHMDLGQALSFISLLTLAFASVNDSLYFMNIYIFGYRVTVSETAILIFSLYEAIAILYSTTHMVESAKKARLLAESQANTLENLNKMKTEFMQNMSHEMKTPLTVIATGTDYSAMQLKKDDADKIEIAQSLDVVKDETARLGRMVSGMVSMLSLSQGENRQKISAGEIIEAAITSLNLMCKTKGNAIVSDVQAEMPPVFVDYDSFIRVLSNMITNSHEHTQNDIIKINARLKSEYVHITVSDNGVGIPKDLIEKVVQRGISGKSSSGYGLYICKTIIEAHGGEIKIESEVNKGTKISFTIPVYAGQEEGYAR